MAKHLHRPIDTSRESVHHKDGDRSNNRLSNLELRKIYHPQGHTHKEKLISNAQYALDFFDELPVSMKREFQTRISSLKEAI